MIHPALSSFLLYTFLLLCIAYVIGASSRRLVSHYNLDLRYNIHKVHNEWYYIFSGKLTDEVVDFIQLDVLIRSDKGTTLYSGILDDYFLNKDGGIDRLYLIKVYRDTKYKMPGDFFIIFGKDIININLTYFKLQEPTSGESNNAMK